jgi:hypothetical protein
MRLTITATAVVAVIASATPAAAKLFGVDYAELTGPGLDRPLRLSDEQFVGTNRRGSRSLSAILGDSKRLPPPPGTLGPRFELELHLEVAMPEQRRVVFRAYLYPHAAAGPVSFTPPGQTWIIPGSGREEIAPGWSRFPARLLGKWRRLGLPSRTEAEGASAYPWGELAAAWGAGAALVMLGSRFVTRAGPPAVRRSRRPRPAPRRGTRVPG